LSTKSSSDVDGGLRQIHVRRDDFVVLRTRVSRELDAVVSVKFSNLVMVLTSLAAETA
jgi:hypothetical protein